MAHVRKIDERQRTVIMVQVENEVAMIDEAADRSATATARFRDAVPPELTKYLAANRASLHPELARAWKQAGERPAGTWEEVFGKGVATEELFMAWHFARYVDAVARAGGKAYDLPLLHQRGAEPAGQVARAISERRAAAAPVRRLEGRRAHAQPAGSGHLPAQLRRLVRSLLAPRATR